jgi:CheY-like chemotaxis protein
VNNNLMVALACAELIERTAGADTQVQQFCASIRAACSNASSLSRQLLTLGRRDVSQPELVSLATLLQRIERLLQTSVGKRVRVQVAVPSNLPRVRVDPKQLEQVLINLAINARDAMPNGGELWISAEEAGTSAPRYDFATLPSAPAHALRLSVRDSGTGIEAALLPQLVEPFFTTKDPEHGTGLGLSVARAFAEASGGRLCIESKLGQGSCFTLELPAAAPAVSAVQPLRRAEKPAQAFHVLVADDDARIRSSMVSELRSAGYQVVEAEDGLAALARAQEMKTVDLLCTDAAMPRLGGEELLERFSTLHPETAILVCSAYVHDEQLRERLRAGRYAVLVKPFSSAELRASVERVLSGPSA